MIRVLLVEDSTTDIKFVKHAFRGLPFEFSVAMDGEEALIMASELLPDLIFLDINLPKIRGDKVLELLKKFPETRAIPVVILTSSTNPDHVRQAYDLQCSAFMSKPVTPAKFKAFADASDLWWDKTVEMPRVANG
jgi:CheY-like chemotaxis protein